MLFIFLLSGGGSHIVGELYLVAKVTFPTVVAFALQNVFYKNISADTKHKENNSCNNCAIFKPCANRAKTVANRASRGFTGRIKGGGAKHATFIQNSNIAYKLILFDRCFKHSFRQTNAVGNVLTNLKSFGKISKKSVLYNNVYSTFGVRNRNVERANLGVGKEDLHIRIRLW